MKRIAIKLNRTLGRLTNHNFIALPGGGIGLKSGGRLRARFGILTEELFKNLTLKWSEKGYWFVFPPVSKSGLSAYYKSAYWANRGGKDVGVSVRDLQHYWMLRELVPQLFYLKDMRALNFGSGHGGLSYLLHTAGVDVTNVEPSAENQSDAVNGWKTVQSIEDVEGESFNLIYGSHSLEHVDNIEYFEEQISKLHGSPFCLGFWEVPNAGRSDSGSYEGRIDIPHTYYFTHAYFRNHFKTLLHLENYSNEAFHPSRWKQFSLEEGEVIRALGLYRGNLPRV